MDFPLSGLEVKDKMFRHVLIAGHCIFSFDGDRYSAFLCSMR